MKNDIEASLSTGKISTDGNYRCDLCHSGITVNILRGEYSCPICYYSGMVIPTSLMGNSRFLRFPSD